MLQGRIASPGRIDQPYDAFSLADKAYKISNLAGVLKYCGANKNFGSQEIPLGSGR
jgi:hypothetical protein